ncbi:MAG: prepilin-type N-terminal cleavage/methylation domain-containing protein [Solirubrobacteraceae bacterium]
MGRRLHISNESGFTIIEVMVAMVILLVGLAGTVTLLDQANASTTSNKAREGAVALSRELVESARSQAYDQLTQGNVVASIRARTGFSASVVGGNGWQIERRGITYTMAVGVCSVDDPNDGLGVADASFCNGSGTTTSAQCATDLGTAGNISGVGTATGAAVGDCGIDLDRDGQVDGLTQGDAGTCATTCTGGGTADTNPDDYKRVVTLVRWTLGSGSRFVLQSTSLPYPGLSGAPRVLTLTGTPASLVVPNGTNFFAAAATTNRKAAGVTWLLDGTPTGNATGDAAGTSWTFTWTLGTTGCPPVLPGTGTTAPTAGEVVDGVYQVGAKALDSYAQAGGTRTQVVTLNRCAPYQPTGFIAARIGGLGVETAWSSPVERDIEGYEVYRVQGAGTPNRVCSLSRSRNCVDTSPPNSGSWDYYVVASDKDASGTVRAGQLSQRVTLDLSNQPPLAPAGALVGSRVNTTSTSVTWLASPGDPDAGDSVAAYRIYRDGTTLSDRYATVPAGTYTYTDTVAGELHTYYVAAVDTKGAESPKTSGVDIP